MLTCRWAYVHSLRPPASLLAHGRFVRPLPFPCGVRLPRRPLSPYGAHRSARQPEGLALSFPYEVLANNVHYEDTRIKLINKSVQIT